MNMDSEEGMIETIEKFAEKRNIVPSTEEDAFHPNRFWYRDRFQEFSAIIMINIGQTKMSLCFLQDLH